MSFLLWHWLKEDWNWTALLLLAFLAGLGWHFAKD